jgi:pimeloyl-ACP methyl ester carboxylesterase
MATATLLRGFRVRTEEIAGVRTRYWVGGDGPPLLLVHGLGGAAVNFTLLAPLLARSHRVLVPDLPGHGGTEPLPSLESLADLGAHALAVAEHEDMLPADVVGYSLGGVVALRATLDRPEEVASLALVASAGIVSTTRRAEIWLAAARTLRPGRIIALAGTSVSRRRRLRRIVFAYWGADDPGALPEEAVQGFLVAQREHSDTTSVGRVLLRDEPRPDLEGIRCPTLVVWGARDRLVPLEDGFEFARRLRCPLRVLPGAGHLVVGECPAELAALLEEFLAGRGGEEAPLGYARFGV